MLLIYRFRSIGFRLLTTLIVFIFLLRCPDAHSENTILPNDINRIVSSGKLVVATYSKDLPPFIFSGVDGKLGGLDVELSDDIAHKLGVTLEFNRLSDYFNNLPSELLSRRADIIISAFSKNLKRAMLVNYTDDYIVLKKVIMINRLATSSLVDSKGNIDLLNSKSVVIGANEGSVYADFAHDLLPNSTIKLYKSHRIASTDLMNGSIIGYICDETCADSYNHPREWHKNSPPAGWGITIRTIPLVKGEDHIAMATNYEDTALHAWLNNYIAQIKEDGSLLKLTAKYLK